MGLRRQGNIMSIPEPTGLAISKRIRKDHELPAESLVHGWRYHHLGIPTDVPRPGESYLAQFKMYVSAFETSPCGIQWMRFEPDSPVHTLIKSVPHVAFEVDDLQAAIEGQEILTAPNSPSEGVTVAMIIANGAPVELLEFCRDLSSPDARSRRGLEEGCTAGAGLRSHAPSLSEFTGAETLLPDHA
jgi:hypothetical protein